MRATLWSDYLCPWCYVAQHREGVLAELGVQVDRRAYELHPEIPPEGRRVRHDGRLAPTFERVEAECDAAGLPFRRPSRMPNTHRALATAEWVRREHPDAFDHLHSRLFAAHFAHGEPLDDPDLLDSLVAEAGAPADPVRLAVDDGRAGALVEASMREAHEHGITATPSWLVGGLVVPGVPEPATLRRWVGRMVERLNRG